MAISPIREDWTCQHALILTGELFTIGPKDMGVASNFYFLALARRDNALTERQLKVGILRIQDIWASLAIVGASPHER